MPYVDGHKVGYGDCHPDFIAFLCRQYQAVQNCQIKEQYVGLGAYMQQLRFELEKLFQAQKEGIFKHLYKNLWQTIEPSLITLPPTKNLIHGDFTANNLLAVSGNKAVILDWEELRYGYAAEDWCGLCLELSGFRGLFGSAKRLRRLCNLVNARMRFSPQEWIYGYAHLDSETDCGRYFLMVYR